jgi:hypothetical protein
MTSPRIIVVTILAGLALAGAPAHAGGKPSKAEAIKVAKAWVEALKALKDESAEHDFKPPTADAMKPIAALTSKDFATLVMTEGSTESKAPGCTPDGCKCEASASSGGLPAALACAMGGFDMISDYEEWTAKKMKDLPGWSLEDRAKAFAKQAKTRRLIFVWGGCDWTHLIAVVKDADGVARVAGAYSGIRYSCGAE